MLPDCVLVLSRIPIMSTCYKCEKSLGTFGFLSFQFSCWVQILQGQIIQGQMPLGPLNWLRLAPNNCRKGRKEPWEFTQGQLLLEILELARLAPDKIESEASRKFTILSWSKIFFECAMQWHRHFSCEFVRTCLILCPVCQKGIRATTRVHITAPAVRRDPQGWDLELR